ncbi:MAG: CapA family protein [Clostridia bacterium]
MTQSNPRTKRVMTIITCVLAISLLNTFTACAPTSAAKQNGAKPNANGAQTAAATQSAAPTQKPDLTAKAVLTAVGDIILHQSVIDGGKQKDGTYKYDAMFTYVAPYFKNSDYAIANYEGALNGPPYSGYPTFGGPDAIAYGLKNAGIDMVTTANNHAYDRGFAGLVRTPTVFAKAKVAVIGTRAKSTDPHFKIASVNGIKIGFIGYTFETTGNGVNKALNGINLPTKANDLIDSFNPYRAGRFAANLKDMAARVKAMKKAKAECIVFVMHWGDEYQTVSNATEKKIAKFLADQGVDLIIGHHPHVIQEISVIHSTVSKKNTLVYYSTGNFLANMEFNTHNTKGYAEDAIIAKVEISRDAAGKIKVTKGEYVGTYVYKDKTTGTIKHKIIPVKAAIASPSKYGMSSQVTLVKNAAARIKKVLSSSHGTKYGIIVRESK